ncbi:MAG: VOC family protein [Rhodospirillaceae bacterium]|nr:VOC family protein [Rhodospirillaceae bacterium]
MASTVIQGLGWFVRRTTNDPLALAAFYEAAVGLRAVRPPREGFRNRMLWAGDIAMFETAARAASPAGAARIGDAVPVLRARDYEAAKAAALAAGARLQREETASGRAAYLLDPDGLPFGLWQAPDAPTFPPDVLADEIWRAGGIALPGIAKPPPAIQDMASVNLKVADPIAMAGFYRAALELDLLGPPAPEGATLALGRTCILELLPGGVERPPPGNRDEVPDVFILRVYDLDWLEGRIQRAGARIVARMEITGGRLIYALDPEGHLFGLQQRAPELLPAGAAERVEDGVARALWESGTR